MTRFCTIAHVARLPQARVLARGLAEHHSDSRLTVLLAGPERLATNDDAFELLRPEELGISGWEKLLEARRWPELREFLKPHLLSRLISEGADPAIYLDAAVDIHAPLEPVMRELERYGVVIAPRLLGELPVDGRRPDRRDLRRAGRFGASLIALGRRPVSVELVRWWAEHLGHAADDLPAYAADPDHPGRDFGRWIDLAPSVFFDVTTLRDPGSAVSYWSLHERHLEREGGRWLVDGRPLRFMHFEGFDPTRPFLLSTRSDRAQTSTSPALGSLCESYAERLAAAGWRDHRRRPDVGRDLPNRLTFDDRLSQLLAEAAAEGAELGDVFSAKGVEAFMDWLGGPAPSGRWAGINRYLYRVYEEREDLRRAYPDLDSTDGEGLAGWAWVFGALEMGIPESLLPPRPPGTQARPTPKHVIDAPKRERLPNGSKPALSVNVTGMLKGTLGLGEAARGYVRALQAAGVPVSTSTVDVHQFVDIGAHSVEGYAQIDYADVRGTEEAGFDLVCVNADELARVAKLNGALFSSRPSIGVWAWETDHIPERWSPAFELLDEIWVYSSYVEENLGRAAPVPVVRVPPPVLPPDPCEVRLELGFPHGFQFLFMFDFFSTIQRKNPVGLIEAFRLAFEPGDGPQLVLKTINGVHRPHAFEEVAWAARGRPDIHVLDRSLSAPQRDALLASCDCYVSLHRSEGLGLPLAECMALGKPVIGTAFSGTTDFMTAENSYPVPYEMTRVGADCEIYPAEGTWANPDTDEAARLMRRVFERPEEAAAKGERARAEIAKLYSPEAVGGLARSRLEEIRALWS